MSVVMQAMIWFAAACWAATITVDVDRNPVRLDESFNLVFQARGSVDADPDFRPLERDFDILNRRQSTNVSFINGQVSNMRQWDLVLMPKRSGELTIASVPFGKDRSPEMSVTVFPAEHNASGNHAAEVLLEVDVQPKRAFVQAQILYTARLYRAVNIENASLTEPTLDDADAVVKTLGEDRTFQMQRNGRRYQVVERRYVIFPQRSGSLTVNPVVFQGHIVSPRQSFFSLGNSQLKRVRSDTLTLIIDPVPASFHGATWIPSGGLHLSEAWPQDPPQFVVGEPVTRTLSIMAEGLTSAQLPAINAPVLPGIKQYPDQPVREDRETHDGMTGFREEKIALIPTQPGRLTIPEVAISWWNTKTNTPETARLPERVIVVQESMETAYTNGQQRASSNEMPAVSIDAPLSDAVQMQADARSADMWPWIAGVLAMGWVVTGVLLWRHHRDAQRMSSYVPKDVGVKRWSVEHDLKKACERDDVNEAKTALLAWGKLQWPDDVPTTIGDIGERSSHAFQKEVRTLNRALYGYEPEKWKGASLSRAFQQFKAQQQEKLHQPANEGLEPLWTM